GIGYLATSQCFHDGTDVLMLTTNMIGKDLNSLSMNEAGIAMSGLSCFINSDLARDLANDIMTLVRNNCIQAAAVNVICELARCNPKDDLGLAAIFFRLMTTSTNNWAVIKIIKLFGASTSLELRLGKKLIEQLTNLIHSTSAMSLLYECINTGLPNHNASTQLCVQKLRILIEDSDQNLKYLGVLVMSKILYTHSKSVQVHSDLIMRCLGDKDESIRLRALDLLSEMVRK
ncbi:unnamed protein product, partial [Rotaria sordida]